MVVPWTKVIQSPQEKVSCQRNILLGVLIESSNYLGMVRQGVDSTEGVAN